MPTFYYRVVISSLSEYALKAHLINIGAIDKQIQKKISLAFIC